MRHLLPKTVRDKLLLATLRNAAENRYYRNCWPSVPLEDEQRAKTALRSLPILYRDEYMQWMESITQSASTALVYHSTGSTGKPLIRYRSAEDLAFNSKFGREVFRGHSVVGRRIVLSEIDTYHSSSFEVPTDDLILAAAGDQQGVRHAADALARRYTIANTSSSVKALVGTSYFLMLVTLELQSRGINPADIGVEQVVVRSGLLTKGLERFLHRSWGCRPHGVYSLSEVLGSANSCTRCGCYRFGATLWAEFLHPFRRHPVDHGWAVPVLTELVPFVTCDPLVRYWTGDLVWLSDQDCDCDCGPFRFAPRGRLSYSLIDQDVTEPAVLLPPIDLIETAELLPYLDWIPPADWITTKFGGLPMGKPRLEASLRVDEDGTKVVKVVGHVKFSANYFDSEIVRLKGELLSGLLACSRSLREAVQNGYRVEIELR